MSSSSSSVKVLHVLGAFERGGVETWLRHVNANIARPKFDLQFVVHTSKKGAYDDELRRAGADLHAITATNPLIYGYKLYRLLKSEGSFTAVHSHVHHFSGFVLLIAALAGVPIRIAHSHLDSHNADSQAGVARSLYLRMMRRLVGKFATRGLGASHVACISLFGPNWESDGRFRVLYCSVDLAPFHSPLNCQRRRELRAEFGIQPGSILVGHVGRFRPQKNHEFLLQIAQAMSIIEPSAQLLLLGDGPLEEKIRAQAGDLERQKRVIFAGVRPDVPDIMKLFDVFLLPSLYEGLALVTIEAQAAGLPLVVSDRVTPETDIVRGLTTFVSLDRTAAEWAHVVLSRAHRVDASERRDALLTLSDSPFNIKNGVRELERIYTTEPAHRTGLNRFKRGGIPAA